MQLPAPVPITMRDVARRIVGDQARELKRLRRPARRGDVEAVHDLRVATRRLRAALRVFADYLPRPVRLRRGLRRLARRLGAVRDRDIVAALLEVQLAQHLGEDERRRLAALLRGLRRQRARALAKLARRLGSADQGRLRRRAKRLAGAGVPGDDEPAAIGLTRAVTLLAADVSRQPAMLEAEPGEDDLHRLRIAVKRLRYALEFHAGAGALAYEAELDTARALQDCLGELHDVDVLRAALRRGEGLFAGPWPAVSRRLREARRAELERFAALRQQWRRLADPEPEAAPPPAFPAIEAAPVQLKLVPGGKQIASAQIR